MSIIRTYRRVSVNQVNLDKILIDHPGEALHVGIDVGKHSLFVVLRWTSCVSSNPVVIFDSPWKVELYADLPLLVSHFRRLNVGRSMVIAFEYTGSYCDPLRQSLHVAGLTVHQVRGKVSHDYSEVFDGVPSKHDGQDAALLADLAAHGHSRLWVWQVPEADHREMNYLVTSFLHRQLELTRCVGRVESLVARYWPELFSLLGTSQGTMLHILKHYGGPSGLRNDAEALRRIYRFSRSQLDSETIRKIIESARNTQGVIQTAHDIRYVCEIGERAVTLRNELRDLDKQFQEMVSRGSKQLQQMRVILGAATACLFWVKLGDPCCYPCARAYLKAMGLNLKERSSGESQSRAPITKRGDPRLRQWIYLAAIRWVQYSPVKAWYTRKRGVRSEGRSVSGTRALVAVMRKLVMGVYAAVKNNEEFDARKLFCEKPSQKKVVRIGAAGLKKHQQKKKQPSKSATESTPKSTSNDASLPQDRFFRHGSGHQESKKTKQELKNSKQKQKNKKNP
jgi:transposase